MTNKNFITQRGRERLSKNKLRVYLPYLNGLKGVLHHITSLTLLINGQFSILIYGFRNLLAELKRVTSTPLNIADLFIQNVSTWF